MLLIRTLLKLIAWFQVLESFCEAIDRASSLKRPIHNLRPFYNIAHMVNSVNEIKQFLDRGANGIEADVFFAPNASALYTFHGHPCDCFRHCDSRERIESYFSHIRQITTPSSPDFDHRLLLLLLDTRLFRINHSAKALAGKNLAELMLEHLYNETTANVQAQASTLRTIISIGHVFDYDFVLGFQNEIEIQGKYWLLTDYIGWDVGMNDPLFAIESMWKRLDMVNNIWQGDGRSNCLSPFYNLGRLTTVLERRDSNSMFNIKNYIRKAYQWTVDLTVNIRTALRANVDALVTNHPERVMSVIRDQEFNKNYRMAVKQDSPWDRFVNDYLHQSYSHNQSPPPQQISKKTSQKNQQKQSIQSNSTQSSEQVVRTTLSLKLINGAGDMFDSLVKFLGETIRNRTPIKYLFLSSYFSKRNDLHQAQKNDDLMSNHIKFDLLSSPSPLVTILRLADKFWTSLLNYVSS